MTKKKQMKESIAPLGVNAAAVDNPVVLTIYRPQFAETPPKSANEEAHCPRTNQYGKFSTINLSISIRAGTKVEPGYKLVTKGGMSVNLIMNEISNTH